MRSENFAQLNGHARATAYVLMALSLLKRQGAEVQLLRKLKRSSKFTLVLREKYVNFVRLK